ncbi:dihydrofolate reductase family protein [Jiangella alba]|uniref:Dihydrofolate reductase n=1 Tax=Jiangella alba TaxID=561176 RepID=A0A1H5GPU8_9ACTN|nr:dihydrofolate reductase family protein [Jiangella alba]SEE17514.1 Dihydrofolate reductase [Jiangella alba]
MKLTAIMQVTVDGVAQGNGGAHPDLDPGFVRGGWAMPHFDDEATAYVEQRCQSADAFLFGRRTYEFFASTWGTIDEMVNSPVGQAFQQRPKYVASTTLTDPGWTPATVVAGADAVRELKAAPGGELQVHGSIALVRGLLENDLVDELELLVFPVVVGEGTRLFPDDGPDHALDLAESRAFPKGVVVQTYRPAGRARYAPVAI